jgi:hypothetical protein
MTVDDIIPKDGRVLPVDFDCVGFSPKRWTNQHNAKLNHKEKM